MMIMTGTISTDTISNRPLRIFLCHGTKDKPAVRKLYLRLRADGFAPWLDEEDLLPGHDWQYEIPKAVRQSDVVIVCLSPQASNKEGYVQKEIKLALDVADEKPEGTIFLIPLKLEECNVPERLSRWQWVNLFSPNGYERLLRALRQRAADLNLPIQPELVMVPGGEFWMGSDELPDEQPPHRRLLPEFSISKYPITNSQYHLFIQATGHRPPKYWRGSSYSPKEGLYPVVDVSWEDAISYCQWLSDVTGQNYRLPTEAEWEKAARGSDRRRYPWGNDFSPKRANVGGEVGKLTPVNLFSSGASPYGCLDMAGNVWEWCSSIYEKYPYLSSDGREDLEREGDRVIRGGSWNDAREMARSSVRSTWPKNEHRADIGFRVVCGSAIVEQAISQTGVAVSDAIDQANSFFSKAGFAIKRIDFELGDMLVSMSKWISHSQYGDILVRVIKGDLSGEYVRSVEQRGKALGASGKIVYVVYEGELLSDAFLQIGTFRLGNDLHVVPLKSSVISEALVSEGKNCYRVLEALEKEYVGHGNPYEYSNAITDPTLFFGRRDAVDRVLNRLRSQQHAGIFGMRKSGKTSLMRHIGQNLSRDSVPFAWLGLQSTSSVDPKQLFADVLRQLRYFLQAKGVTDTLALKLLSDSSQTDVIQAFREDILALWEVAKGKLRVPFMVIMIDEVERIVPTSHSDLIAYQRYDEFFAPIRDLAQIERCLFTVVNGEKPVIREEFDTSRFPSNAMFELYDEGYLPFFTSKECADMVSKIGKLIDIDFSNEAQNQIYRESAGHPYIARVLCARIVDSMEKKREVSTSAVEMGVPTALDNLNEYFKSLWMKTTSDEKEVIRSILTRREPVSNFDEQQRDAVRLLQKLGLIQQRADGAWEISINLFTRWLERRIGHHV